MNSLEKIENHAAGIIVKDYTHKEKESVTDTLKERNTDILQNKRLQARQMLFI